MYPARSPRDSEKCHGAGAVGLSIFYRRPTLPEWLWLVGSIILAILLWLPMVFVQYIIWTKSVDTGPDQTTVLLTSDIAIVGATGFIGRHVCGLLDRSASRVVAVSRNPDLNFLATYAPSVEAMRLEHFLSAEEFRRRARLRRVIYLAHSQIDYFATRNAADDVIANLGAAALLLDSVLDANRDVEIIYVSSGGQIYGQTEMTTIAESIRPTPNSPYGLAKLLIEEYISYLGRRIRRVGDNSETRQSSRTLAARHSAPGLGSCCGPRRCRLEAAHHLRQWQQPP